MQGGEHVASVSYSQGEEGYHSQLLKGCFYRPAKSHRGAHQRRVGHFLLITEQQQIREAASQVVCPNAAAAACP